jgi:hypothetical protein
VTVQTAILHSNAAVLGAVNEFRAGMDQRLDRQFGEVREKFALLGKQVDGVCETVGGIVTDRAIEAALAKRTRELDAQSEEARNEHVLSERWRVGIVLAATTGLGALLLNLFNVFVIGK